MNKQTLYKFLYSPLCLSNDLYNIQFVNNVNIKIRFLVWRSVKT